MIANQRKSRIVVGIGNPMLKDDRAGLEVVQASRACTTTGRPKCCAKLGWPTTPGPG